MKPSFTPFSLVSSGHVVGGENGDFIILEILAISPSSWERERGSLLTKRSQSNFEQTHQTKLNLFHSPHLNLPQLILKYISNDFSILLWLTFNILEKLFLCSNLEVKQILFVFFLLLFLYF